LSYALFVKLCEHILCKIFVYFFFYYEYMKR